MSDFKYPSALIKMTHDFDLTDCQFATVAETLSKKRRRKMGAKSEMKKPEKKNFN